MKRTLNTAAAVLCLLLTAGVAVSQGQTGEEMRIFDLVNAERAKQRLQPLQWNSRIANVAREHSRQMARHGFFGHQDQHGRTVVDRAEDGRVGGWSKIGENLFMCERINDFEPYSVRGWLRSPSHRRNMLDRGWKSTGIGVHRSGDGRIYVTQVFLA